MALSVLNIAGADYNTSITLPIELRLTPSVDQTCFTLSVEDDDIEEDDEDLVFELKSLGTTEVILSPSQLTVTITDNDRGSPLLIILTSMFYIILRSSDINECTETRGICQLGDCIDKEDGVFYECECNDGAMLTGSSIDGTLTCIGIVSMFHSNSTTELDTEIDYFATLLYESLVYGSLLLNIVEPPISTISLQGIKCPLFRGSTVLIVFDFRVLIFCSLDINECLGTPCGPLGTCINNDNAQFYQCICPNGTTTTGLSSLGTLTCIGKFMLF